MMEHIKDVPHIIGFQLDNETKSYGTAGPRVQAMFVDYLKENTRISMNSIASSGWTTGATASTHGKISRISCTINESLAAEFAKFQRLLVTRFLAWQAAIVSGYKRRISSSHRTSTTTGQTIPSAISRRSTSTKLPDA